MKKIVAIIVCAILCVSCAPLFGCKKNTLNIYNCYDYIDEDLLDEFEDYYKEVTGEKINVKYSTFDTPEDAYNNLKIDPKAYDLICPSDYMIEKMAREGMLQTYTMDANGEYMKNLSPYIKGIFDSISWGNGESLSDYAVGYMWGTLGLVYNPKTVDDKDMESWASLWSAKYKDMFSIKDSVRDTYFIALAKFYQTELLNAKTAFTGGGELSVYQSALKGYFNDVSSATIGKVKNVLVDLGNNCKNLEIDEGKMDIADGKIDINFAWSGDAVYAIDYASEENDITLKYSVPEEGSNVWFDGWVIPKESTKVDAAKMFLDFISTPANVVRNMDYIGYTSVIAGEEVFEYVADSYDEGEGEETDLSYFFGEGDYTISTTDEKGMFYAQYPTKEVIERCVVMSYFETEANNSINTMWIEFKSKLN